MSLVVGLSDFVELGRSICLLDSVDVASFVFTSPSKIPRGDSGW